MKTKNKQKFIRLLGLYRGEEVWGNPIAQEFIEYINAKVERLEKQLLNYQLQQIKNLNK